PPAATNSCRRHDSYTYSLHDALPISEAAVEGDLVGRFVDHGRHQRASLGAREHLVDRLEIPAAIASGHRESLGAGEVVHDDAVRSEEHTSELQSRENLVCRRLLEKKI